MHPNRLSRSLALLAVKAAGKHWELSAKTPSAIFPRFLMSYAETVLDEELEEKKREVLNTQ